jgi:hypothetical protein
MEYKDGKPGGFDPHKRIPDMDADALLAVLALDDARRAIAEIGIDVAIPQVEWFEDVAVGVDDVVGTGHRHPFQSGRLPIILAPPVADDTAYV